MTKRSNPLVPTGGEFLLYQSEDGSTRIECRFDDETVWLTQAQMAELFQTTPQNITLHLKEIFSEGELIEEASCKEYLQVRREGRRPVTRSLRHYRLEVVLAVGFRVRSHRGTQFRQWAIERLDEYLVSTTSLLPSGSYYRPRRDAFRGGRAGGQEAGEDACREEAAQGEWRQEAMTGLLRGAPATVL